MLEILKDLENLSEKLNLNFNKDWFGYVWVTKEQEILTVYLSDCRDSIYEKYGHEISERVNNLENFYNSKDYKNLIKICGGQVISKKSFAGYREFVSDFKNKEIKNILLDFCDRIDKKIGKLEKVAVLTETDIETEKENLLNGILSHEWIHILLEQNNLHTKNWKYNEGLVTYIDYSMRNKLDELESYEKEMNSDFGKEYFRNAILFRNLVKNVFDKEKIEKIKDFLKLFS
ncbi:hypothetical protein KAT24_01185 [Candidatus Pacearchaeota archaeon]|nr:hypothetical protein [Candidatus Pacearchaeota archaeon]